MTQLQGDFSHGDYYLANSPISPSFLRAVFGVWLTFSSSIVALSLCSIYRSRTITRLYSRAISNNPYATNVCLWHVAPPSSSSEVFYLRKIIFNALKKGEIMYVVAALSCVLSAGFSAASASIADQAVGQAFAIRGTLVNGALVTRDYLILSKSLPSLTLKTKSRVEALERAGAPLEELFDFAPDDNSNWLYRAEQWNNSWTGSCSFHNHSSVQLSVLSSTTDRFQDEVLGLEAYLPPWAAEDWSKQATHYIGFNERIQVQDSFYDHLPQEPYNTGIWRDALVTYVFGSAPPSGLRGLPSVNISFANFLAHSVPRGSNTRFLNASFMSDVHVVECTFQNVAPGANDQADPDSGGYEQIVENVANIYMGDIMDTSSAGLSVVQPTAKQMLRNYQAFMSVKGTGVIHPVQRTLAVAQMVVRLRLSIMLATVIAFVITVTLAFVAYYLEPRDRNGKHFSLPSSPFDWTVHAAKEHFACQCNPHDLSKDNTLSPLDYAKRHDNLLFIYSRQKGASDGSHIFHQSISTINSSEISASALDCSNHTQFNLRPQVHMHFYPGISPEDQSRSFELYPRNASTQSNFDTISHMQDSEIV